MSDYVITHHGIKGQRWGVRRYQNDDGSLTPAGKSRYGRLERKNARLGSKIEKASGKVEKSKTKQAKIEPGLHQLNSKEAAAKAKVLGKQAEIDNLQKKQQGLSVLGFKPSKHIDKQIQKQTKQLSKAQRNYQKAQKNASKRISKMEKLKYQELKQSQKINKYRKKIEKNTAKMNSLVKDLPSQSVQAGKSMVEAAS